MQQGQGSSYARPSAGTTTGAVWALADRITRKQGYKAKRKQVTQAFEREGGNANTASTQYYYWSKAYDASEEEPGNSVPSTVLKIEANGRLVLPVEIRKAMGIEGEMKVTAQVVDGELRMITPVVAMEKLQKLASKLKKPGESVVDEFLRERRARWGEE